MTSLNSYLSSFKTAAMQCTHGLLVVISHITVPVRKFVVAFLLKSDFSSITMSQIPVINKKGWVELRVSRIAILHL